MFRIRYQDLYSISDLVLKSFEIRLNFFSLIVLCVLVVSFTTHYTSFWSSATGSRTIYYYYYYILEVVHLLKNSAVSVIFL